MARVLAEWVVPDGGRLTCLPEASEYRLWVSVLRVNNRYFLALGK